MREAILAARWPRLAPRRPGDFPVGAACRIDARAPSRTIAEIPVGLDPEGVQVDSRRRRAYVACSRADFVAVVDLETNEKVAEIGVGSEPIDLAYDPATDRIFTADAHSDSVSVVDAETLELVPRQSTVGLYPSGLTADHACAAASTAATRSARR